MDVIKKGGTQMKKIVFIALALFILTGIAYTQEETKIAKSYNTGLSISFDYYSMYIWRGTKFFAGDGAFCPAISWEIFGSGVSLSVAAEISQSYLFNGFQPKPTKFYYDAGGVPYIKRLKINNAAYASHSVDFGLDFSRTIKEAVTIGASVWYWMYFNSPKATELAKLQVSYGPNMYSKVDISFITASLSIGLDIVPYINPVISVTYDHYTALAKTGDIYAMLALSHDFELTKEVAITLGVSAGYYYAPTLEATYYYFSTTDPTDFSTYAIERSRTPLKKGVSDVTPSVGLTFTKGGLSISAGFNWVIVPAKSWYKGDENHRYYANLGISYSI